MLTAFAAGCQQCGQTLQAQRSNVDRVGDAVLVTGSSGDTFMVTTNPELQHLRVLDLSKARFVDAPNKYFPASIPVGPETRRIAAAPGDDSRVFALDASADQVFVVRTETKETSGVNWSVVGTPIATERAPGDLAAFREAGGVVRLYVTIPDQHLLQVLDVGDGASVPPLDFGAGSIPANVVVDPFGDSVVVGDAGLGVVHVIDRASLDAGAPVVTDLDVGGPVGDLSVGVVDIGDGDAPVVLALRSDANIAVAIRLFRPGFREDRYAVLGSAELPDYPLVGYVPDNRSSATVCCRALSVDAVNAGEATAAWAAVGMSDGSIVYLRLKQPLVRPFDSDPAPIALGAPADTDWQPQPGDENRRPVPALAAADNFGDPPFVPLLDPLEQLTLVWEGPPPGLVSVPGTFEGSDTFHATVNTEARGARVGDIVVVQTAETPPQCGANGPVTGTVTSVSGSTLGVSINASTFRDCVAGGGDVSLVVDAKDAFVVFRGNGDFLGRLTFSGPESQIALPGAVLSIAPSTSGPPRTRGSTLAVPINPHVTLVQLPLSAPPLGVAAGGGGFGSAGNFPVAITGGEMKVPDPAAPGTTQTIVTRRMQIGTASQDSFGLNVIFSCDEGESIPDFCDPFK